MFLFCTTLSWADTQLSTSLYIAYVPGDINVAGWIASAAGRTNVYPAKSQEIVTIGNNSYARLVFTDLPAGPTLCRVQAYNELFISDATTINIQGENVAFSRLFLTANIDRFELFLSTNLSSWTSLGIIPINAPVSIPTTVDSMFFRGYGASSNWLSISSRAYIPYSSPPWTIVSSYYNTTTGTINEFDYVGVAYFTNVVTTNRWFVAPAGATNCTITDITPYMSPSPIPSTPSNTSLIRSVRRRDAFVWYNTNALNFPVSGGEQYRIALYSQNSWTNRVNIRIEWK